MTTFQATVPTWMFDSSSTEQAINWAAKLIKTSTPFTVEPLPDDYYCFKVKFEIEPHLSEILGDGYE